MKSRTRSPENKDHLHTIIKIPAKFHRILRIGVVFTRAQKVKVKISLMISNIGHQKT